MEEANRRKEEEEEERRAARRREARAELEARHKEAAKINLGDRVSLTLCGNLALFGWCILPFYGQVKWLNACCGINCDSSSVLIYNGSFCWPDLYEHDYYYDNLRELYVPSTSSF